MVAVIGTAMPCNLQGIQGRMWECVSFLLALLFSLLTPMPVISAESWHELSFDTLLKVRGAREMPLHHSATVLSHLNY